MAFGKVLAQTAIHDPCSRNLFPFRPQRASRLRDISCLQQPIDLMALPVVFRSLTTGLIPILGQDTGTSTDFIRRSARS